MKRDKSGIWQTWTTEHKSLNLQKDNGWILELNCNAV